MQTLIDPQTQEVWQFDDDVIVTQSEAGYTFTAAHGEKLDVPLTLIPLPEDWTPPEPAPVIPQSVTRRQGRLALLEVGHLDDAEAAINAIEDLIQRRAAQIEYEADKWERDNAFLQSVWAQMGGTEADLDGLFMLASTK